MERLFIVGRPNLGRQASFYSLSLSRVTHDLSFNSLSKFLCESDHKRERAKRMKMRFYLRDFYSLSQFRSTHPLLFALSQLLFEWVHKRERENVVALNERIKENVQNVQKSDSVGESLKALLTAPNKK